MPEPRPGPGEALVRVRLAALNFFDTLIIENRYQLKPPLPFSPGAEFCGTVEALGPGTDGVKVGERVIGSIGYGACRELVTAEAKRLTPVPDGVSDEQAAGLTITYGTSLHALKDRAKLEVRRDPRGARRRRRGRARRRRDRQAHGRARDRLRLRRRQARGGAPARRRP